MKLQGHEKFSIREGWLNKGMIILADPEKNRIFQDAEASIEFGIGTNMVKSLRYWMKAMGLMDEKAGDGAFLTDTGNLIMKNDIYLEDTFSLWVMHSSIARNIDYATTWYMYFNRCDAATLNKEELEKILIREVTKYADGKKFSDKSVGSDLDVLLNMYSKEKRREDPEDKNNSPFSVLGLVKKIDGKYEKAHPDRRIISEWNVLYELANLMKYESSISIEKAISGEMGLEKIYHMSSVLANELLDVLDTMGYIRVDRTAGLDMIYKLKEFDDIEVIREYYAKKK